MNPTKTIIIVAVVIVAITVLVIHLRKSQALPPHLKSYFKNKAELDEFIKRTQQIEARIKNDYFPEGTKATAERIIEVYRELKYKSVAERMEAESAPCFRLDINKSVSKPFCSRIGGLPDLPDNNLWPKKDGKSLAFISQINLKELPEGFQDNGLPRNGILYFFYDSEQSVWGFDPKDKGNWAVIYSKIPESVPAIEYPKDLPDHGKFSSVSVRLQPETSIPHPHEIFSDFSLSHDQEFEVGCVYNHYAEDAETCHQFLGHAIPIQGDMKLGCQLASNGLYCGNETGYNDPRAKELELGASQWRLLLQIGSEDEANMMWGDVGTLYFWIKEDDLRNKRFENVWVILQCG